MKIVITFVALYFIEAARAQHGDLSALLGLASGKRKKVLYYDGKRCYNNCSNIRTAVVASDQTTQDTLIRASTVCRPLVYRFIIKTFS